MISDDAFDDASSRLKMEGPKKKSSYEKSEKIVSGYLGARADLKVWCETEYCAKL